MKRLPIAALLLLTGCGAAKELQPLPGKSLPVAPVGARATPTPLQLSTPSTQARPARSDELLTNSNERRVDEFDLPPPN